VLVHARAPVRISFSGGISDFDAYAWTKGGLVLNATISKYVYVTLRPQGNATARIHSASLGASEVPVTSERGASDDPAGFVAACAGEVLSRLRLPAKGVDLYVETDVPLGTGLGTSSALVVALVGAVYPWCGHTLDKHEAAKLGWEIERRDLGIAGGLQDHYAASFGGLNLIEFHGPADVVVTPLRVGPEVLSRLEYSLLLVYTGLSTSDSLGVIADQLARHQRGEREFEDAVDRIKALTLEARDALLSGRPEVLGEVLHEAWLQKKRTSPMVTTSHVDAIPTTDANECDGISCPAQLRRDAVVVVGSLRVGQGSRWAGASLSRRWFQPGAWDGAGRSDGWPARKPACLSHRIAARRPAQVLGLNGRSLEMRDGWEIRPTGQSRGAGSNRLAGRRVTGPSRPESARGQFEASKGR